MNSEERDALRLVWTQHYSFVSSSILVLFFLLRFILRYYGNFSYFFCNFVVIILYFFHIAIVSFIFILVLFFFIFSSYFWCLRVTYFCLFLR